MSKGAAAAKHQPLCRVPIIPRTRETRMPAWTTAQEELLATYSNLGPQWCAEEIHRLYGVKRTAEATKEHGWRIGLSWKVYDTCRSCGKVVKRLEKDGTCKPCHYKELAERQRRLADEANCNTSEDAGSAETVNAKRAFDRQRQRLARLRKNVTKNVTFAAQPA